MRESSGYPLPSSVSQCHAEGAAVIAEAFHPKPGLQTGGGNLTSALQCSNLISAMMCHTLYSLYP